MSGLQHTPTAEGLLLALQAARGDAVPLETSDALRLLVDCVGEVGRGALLRRFGRGLRDDLADDALGEVTQTCWLGAFRGGSPGEAVRFVSVCAEREYLSILRTEIHSAAWDFEHDPESGGDRAVDPSGLHAVDAAQSDGEAQAAARSMLEKLWAMRGRLLLAAPYAQKRRIRVYLDHRLSGEEDDEGSTPETGDGVPRAAANVYQDRSVGKRYARAVAETLRPGLSEAEVDLMDRLLNPVPSECRRAPRPGEEDDT